MIERVAIVGTGLIGASIGLALREGGFEGTLIGIDSNPEEAAEAKRIGAVDRVVSAEKRSLEVCATVDLVVLSVPVLAIMNWIERLAPVLGPQTLVTDVGSTKLAIGELARTSFVGVGRARFLPGHPMAGKESGGAALAEAKLFHGAMWLFTPLDSARTELEVEWRRWVEKFG
jgi:prephenate dehydrogenase